jgi:hypothetical protein
MKPWEPSLKKWDRLVLKIHNTQPKLVKKPWEPMLEKQPALFS